MSEEKPAPTDYANDQVKVVMTRRSNCLIELGVEVSPLAATAAEMKAVRNVTKQVSLPGFRKGKAPEAVIRKRYSQAIEEEWRELIVSTAFQEALKLTKVYPFSESTIRRPKVERASLEEGALIRFEFEAYPQIPEVDPNEVSVSRPEAGQVSESEIEEQLNRLREQNADYEAIDGRGVQENDFVLLDAFTIEGGEERRILKGERFKVSKESLSEWIVRDIIGKSQGESFEGTSEIDSDASEEEKAQFEPKQVRIVVQAIQKEIAPSDEKLVELRKKGSFEELKQEIRDYLQSSRDQQADSQLREALWERVVSRYPFEVPQSLVDTELRSLMRERLERLKREGTSDEEIQSRKEQIEAEVLKEALLRLHTFFFVQAITARHKLEVTQSEVQKHLSSLLFYQRLLRQQQDEKTLYDHAHYLAAREKVENFLLQEVGA